MNRMVNIAMQYKHNYGFCTIPVNGKVSLVKWTEFQDRLPTDNEIRNWWEDQYKGAGIAIVTGKVSGNLCVVDEDSYKDNGNTLAILPHGFKCPMSKTPRGGLHYWMKSKEEIGDAIGFLPNYDFRSKGIIIAPPSPSYKWIVKLKDVSLPFIPDKLYNMINSNRFKKQTPFNGHLSGDSSSASHSHDASSGPESSRDEGPFEHKDYIALVYKFIVESLRYSTKSPYIECESQTKPKYFIDGTRETDLFSLANVLVKSGKDIDYIRDVITRVMFTCHDVDPKFIEDKINNAIKRHGISAGLKLSDRVDRWINESSGDFSGTMCDMELGFVTVSDRANRRKYFQRLVKRGVIENVGKKRGWYRKVDKTVEILDWQNADIENEYDLKMPLNIHSYAKLFPGNIVVISGVQNCGKTSFALNIVKLNMQKHDVWYFNSEMGAEELRLRLSHFEDLEPSDWKFNCIERMSDFQDVIKPDGLNIIDFLEIETEFWLVSREIRKIYEKLDKGIAVICIQQDIGSAVGRGGSFSLEKARLYISLTFQKLKLVKVKCPRFGTNANGKEIDFKLIEGTTFIETGG